MPNLLEANGGQPQKQPKYVPIFMDRAFTGLYTQRAVLHDPSDVYTAKYYGGRPDALWMGLNIELTNRLTLQRRPGLSPFSTVLYPTAPNRAFSFELLNGTIEVVIDTGSTGNLVLTAAADASMGTTTYIGTITGGASNAFVGMSFQVTGFTNIVNNGTFVVVSSTANTLTLANSQGISETHAGVAQSSGAVFLDNQDGTKTLLFAKSPAAGQMYFIGVAGILYMGDGVDTIKYTPGNPNGTIWKWGIVAPAKQPNVVIQESGSATVQWVPLTVWSTMGIIYDSTTDSTQQITSISPNTDNSTGAISTTLGLTGGGTIVWNQNPGGTTSDGSITWHNFGPIGTWKAGSQYLNASDGGTALNPCIIYDPITKACYLQSNSNSGLRTSGTVRPNFVAAPGAHTPDNQIVWIYIGVPGIPGTWQPNHTYPALGTQPNNDAVSSITEPVSLQNGLPTDGTPVYWQISRGGTSGALETTPFSAGAGAAGFPTTDGDITWTSLGEGSWVAASQVTAWTASGALFSAIKDPNGNIQVCVTGGQTGATEPGTGSNPPWGTTYGATTADGTDVVWVCVGQSMSWVAQTQWFLPVQGFAPPSSASPFGGASIIDTNNNVEFVINSGLGKDNPHPVWNTVSGGSLTGSATADGDATWYNEGIFSTQSLVWKFGHVYAYSFKARSLTDFYSVPDPATGLLPVPPGLSNPLPAPTGSETGAISTASPVFTITGGNNGAVNTVSGIGSLDPQVDTIVIWRDADGGGPDNMFELTEIPAPKPQGDGTPGVWSFRDFLPDVATNTFPGLNVLIPAPIDDSNDPPPAGFLPMVFNYERIWGANGQQVNFSGGPDTPVGNPNENFAPADELPFLANVVRLVQTPQGIVTFLTDSIQMIGGGPATATFFSVAMAPGVGLLSYNAMDVFAGEMYFFSSDNQFRIMTPSLNLSNYGFPLGDQFANMPTSGISDATWDPNKVYVAVHQNGTDNCIMVADGSTGWYRLNPHQVPGAAQGPEPIWSPFAAITGGAKMVQSVQVAPGIKKLLVGSPLPNQNIRFRDLSVFTDSFNFTPLFPTAPGFDAAVTASSPVSHPTVTMPPINVVAPNEWAFFTNPGGTPDGSGWTQVSGGQFTKFLGSQTGSTVFSGTQSNSYAVAVATFFTNGVAPTIAQHTAVTSGITSVSATFNSTTTAHNSYLAVITGAMSAGTPAVTDTEDNDWSVIANVNNGAILPQGCIMAFANNVVGGSADTITVTGLVLANSCQMIIYELAGIGNTAPTVTSTYDANFTMGSITLAHPGQLSIMKFLEFDFAGVGFKPTISYLLNEISGTFSPFVNGANGVPQPDPPSLYGQTIQPKSYSPNRYYFSSNAQIARCRHLQVKVDFGSTSTGDELYNMTIFGRFITEN